MTEQGVEVQRYSIQGWIHEMRNDPNFAESIDNLYQLLQNPIEDVATPVLLRLEENDKPFWHDCIKHGVNHPDCTRQQLKAEWELQKAFFLANKVADALFDDFDALFRDEAIPLTDLKTRFKELYLQLNGKICSSLRERSQTLEGWLNALADGVENDPTAKYPFEFHYENATVYHLTLCTGPELSRVVKEILRNALQHGTSKASITVTEQQLLIKNDGAFDATKWEQSPKAQDTRRTCEEYHLNFKLNSDVSANEVNVVISWERQPWERPVAQSLSVNAKTIIEGGNYDNAQPLDC